MKRLIYPLMLVVFSLFTAALFTAVTATALASYAKTSDENAPVVEIENLSPTATASR